MKNIAVIHTSFVSIADLGALFTEIIPEARIVNIVDDSLLPEVMENGGVTPAVTRRICALRGRSRADGRGSYFQSMLLGKRGVRCRSAARHDPC